MLLGLVRGTVVASERSDELEGARYLLVEVCTIGGEGTGSFIVVLDVLGAGEGEMVLVSQGSSARQTAVSKNRAVDAITVGIVDRVYESDGVAYRK